MMDTSNRRNRGGLLNRLPIPGGSVAELVATGMDFIILASDRATDAYNAFSTEIELKEMLKNSVGDFRVYAWTAGEYALTELLPGKFGGLRKLMDVVQLVIFFTKAAAAVYESPLGLGPRIAIDAISPGYSEIISHNIENICGTRNPVVLAAMAYQTATYLKD